MLFFNIPDIFSFGDSARQQYDAHYSRNLGRDSRNSALLEPLETSLNNLQNIRLRIGTRIEKEVASGTNMTASLNLLDSADKSLEYAIQEVSTATSTITGTNPRPGYIETENAYIALNQTRSALSAVIDSIETDIINQASSTAALASSTKHLLNRTKNVKK